MPISALDANTVKLITTTQVISSIYSVVKELVENALDANADNIEINLVCNNLFNTKYICLGLDQQNWMEGWISFILFCCY